jgi:hypothetical protein
MIGEEKSSWRLRKNNQIPGLFGFGSRQRTKRMTLRMAVLKKAAEKDIIATNLSGIMASAQLGETA